MEPELTTFRDSLRSITPTWLQNAVGSRFMYAIAVHADAFADAVTFGVKSRFPNVYSHESLPFIGRDRRIRRGRIETDEVYASRLRRWLTDHSTRGGPYALLAQVFAHFAPSNFAVELVYVTGRRFSLDVNGDVTRDDIAWTPDATPERWARYWLFYRWPTAITADGTWSDSGTWSDGGVWDSNLTLQEATDLRIVPKEWNAAHCLGRVVLLSGDLELWDYPTGTWGDAGSWTAYGPAQLAIG